MPKRRKNPRNAPIDRFIWNEGDVTIVYDPSEEARKERENSDNRKPKENSDSSGLDEDK